MVAKGDGLALEGSLLVLGILLRVSEVIFQSLATFFDINFLTPTVIMGVIQNSGTPNRSLGLHPCVSPFFWSAG